MRILLVHPGASWSVSDVWCGILGALERAGVEVAQYALDGRIQTQNEWFRWLWKRRKRQGQPLDPYSEADILYAACEGVVTRALRLKADWVLFIAGTYVHPATFHMCRQAGLKIATILTESPYADEQETKLAGVSDVVWTNERASVPTFAAVCPQVYYWQHAMDPERHQVEEQTGLPVAGHDVVFVCTAFIERIRMIEAVNWEGIDLGLYGNWELMGSRNPLRRYIRGKVIDNRLTAALYHKAKIGLNIHRTSIGYGREVPHVQAAESMNPRLYELAACGTFFITDPRAEVAEVFGGLVPTFRTPEELEALIRRYLADAEARQAIAAQLPAKVAGHTFDARIQDVLAVLDGRRG